MSDDHPSLSPAPAAVCAERRTRVRYTASLEACCRRTGDACGQTWPGRVVNISTGGIGLLLGQSLPADTLLDVELHVTTGAALLVLRVRVVHCTLFKDQGTPSWLLGCAFAKELGDDELWPLIEGEG